MNFAKTVRVKSRWLQCHQKKHLGWSKHFLILLFNEIFSRNLVCKRFRFSINISDLTSNDFGQIVLTYTDSKSTVLRSSQRALRRGTTQYTLHSCCQHSQKKPLLLKIIKLSYFFSKLSHESLWCTVCITAVYCNMYCKKSSASSFRVSILQPNTYNDQVNVFGTVFKIDNYMYLWLIHSFDTFQ